MSIHARSEVWPGQIPTNSTGSVRAKLAPFRPFLTCHHGGAGAWLDPDDSPIELRAIQAYAVNAKKPWEYNYVVDGQGEIWTYAGEYQAAHSEGENNIAIGVLLLINAEVEKPPEAMIAAFRFLRYSLVEGGLLSDAHELRQHRQMPGALTACPGKYVIARWGDFSAPWQPPKPPEPDTPQPPRGELVITIIQVNGDGAAFGGVKDSLGDFMQIEWLNPLRYQALIDHQHPIIKLERGDLKNCTLLGALPSGWSADDFAQVIGD